jgi:hypothetical protein
MSESNNQTNPPKNRHPRRSDKYRVGRSATKQRRPRSIFFPLLLVGMGVFLVLNNMGYVQGDTWQVLMRLWPLLFVVGGLDGLIQQNGYVGSIMGIGAGGILLAWNLGYLGYLGIDGWSILRLWPVLLVAWGLDLVIGRRGWISALIGIPVGLALVAGVLWLGTSPLNILQAPQQDTLIQPLDGAEEATMMFSNNAGFINIATGANAKNLIEGELLLRDGETIDPSYIVRDRKGKFTLENQNGISAFTPFSNRIGWDISLNSETPLSLAADLGAGEHLIDLTNLTINRLDVDLGAGRVVITLPEDGDFQGDINMGAGELTLRIPHGTNIRIDANTALTAVSYPDGYRKSEDIITSPDAWKADELIELKVDLPLGILVVQNLP